MSQDSQVPFLFTLSSGSLLITRSRAFTVYTAGAATTLTNSQGQAMNLPSGITYEIQADTGNTLSDFTIAPSGGATAYVSMIGGIATVTP